MNLMNLKEIKADIELNQARVDLNEEIVDGYLNFCFKIIKHFEDKKSLSRKELQDIINKK